MKSRRIWSGNFAQLFLVDAVVGLDPIDNLPDLVRAIAAEIHEEDAIGRKKTGISVKGFFHPGSWNEVKGLPEKDQVMLFPGNIGENVGPYILVLPRTAVLRAALCRLSDCYPRNIDPGVIVIASWVQFITCISGSTAEIKDASPTAISMNKLIYPSAHRVIEEIPSAGRIIPIHASALQERWLPSLPDWPQRPSNPRYESHRARELHNTFHASSEMGMDYGTNGGCQVPLDRRQLTLTTRQPHRLWSRCTRL